MTSSENGVKVRLPVPVYRNTGILRSLIINLYFQTGKISSVKKLFYKTSVIYNDTKYEIAYLHTSYKTVIHIIMITIKCKGDIRN